MLDDITIKNRIKELTDINPLTGEPIFELTQEQIDKIPDLFKSLMKEDRNKNLSIKNQFSLLDDIINGFADKEKAKDIFREYGDNQHMIYFDIVFGKGQADVITEILHKYGLNTTVLRGLQYKETDTTKDGVTIIQHMGKDEHDSIVVEYFEIIYNGKTIYKYGRNDGIEVFEPDYNEEPQKPKRKSQTKSTYEGTVITFGDDVVTKWTTSKGKTVYRDNKGRFAKRL